MFGQPNYRIYSYNDELAYEPFNDNGSNKSNPMNVSQSASGWQMKTPGKIEIDKVSIADAVKKLGSLPNQNTQSATVDISSISKNFISEPSNEGEIETKITADVSAGEKENEQKKLRKPNCFRYLNHEIVEDQKDRKKTKIMDVRLENDKIVLKTRYPRVDRLVNKKLIRLPFDQPSVEREHVNSFLRAENISNWFNTGYSNTGEMRFMQKACIIMTNALKLLQPHTQDHKDLGWLIDRLWLDMTQADIGEVNRLLDHFATTIPGLNAPLIKAIVSKNVMNVHPVKPNPYVKVEQPFIPNTKYVLLKELRYIVETLKKSGKIETPPQVGDELKITDGLKTDDQEIIDLKWLISGLSSTRYLSFQESERARAILNSKLMSSFSVKELNLLRAKLSDFCKNKQLQ